MLYLDMLVDSEHGQDRNQNDSLKKKLNNYIV